MEAKLLITGDPRLARESDIVAFSSDFDAECLCTQGFLATSFVNVSLYAGV